MGVMDIDPLKLLEDGVRSQVAARIAQTCATSFVFPHRAAPLGFGELGGSRDGGLLGLFGGPSVAAEVPDKCEPIISSLKLSRSTSCLS